MKVLVWARQPSLARAKEEGHEVAPSKEAFYEQCDVVSLHMRLVKETAGSITAADLVRMKPTALLVNTEARLRAWRSASVMPSPMTNSLW
jgi:D-3-phosphoglycerate dehydrogenase / 2-oxoglutarate reductase